MSSYNLCLKRTHVKWSMNVPWCAMCYHLNGKKFNDWNKFNEFLILKTQKNNIMTHVHKLVVQFLNTCDIFISYIIVASRVAIRCNYIWTSMYGWTCILAPYICVAYVVSHAIECHVQLVLCNYTNLQLHVLHATEF